MGKWLEESIVKNVKAKFGNKNCFNPDFINELIFKPSYILRNRGASYWGKNWADIKSSSEFQE